MRIRWIRIRIRISNTRQKKEKETTNEVTDTLALAFAALEVPEQPGTDGVEGRGR
jgi:hypothetical protein